MILGNLSQTISEIGDEIQIVETPNGKFQFRFRYEWEAERIPENTETGFDQFGIPTKIHESCLPEKFVHPVVHNFNNQPFQEIRRKQK